jgi:hypothetical protein
MLSGADMHGNNSSPEPPLPQTSSKTDDVHLGATEYFSHIKIESLETDKIQTQNM